MRLDEGQRFPTVSGDTVVGGRLSVPDDLEKEWSVLLFYRGHF